MTRKLNIWYSDETGRIYGQLVEGDEELSATYDISLAALAAVMELTAKEPPDDESL